ncbi:MAG: hypothetical protein R2705_11685 [Ilumatobacteraceae bacterium]
MLASTVPPCQAYDPRSLSSLPIVKRPEPDVRAGSQDVFYYLTVYNENYVMPAMPDRRDRGRDRPGSVLVCRCRRIDDQAGHDPLLRLRPRRGPGGRRELAEHYDVGVELWSATSYKTLREQAIDTERWNRFHPEEEPRTPLVAELLADAPGPIVAVSDFMRIVPEQVARFLPGRSFTPLGTDGMGRSDTREALRRHFEVDAGHVVVAVLSALAAQGEIKPEQVAEAIQRYGIDPEAASPIHS